VKRPQERRAWLGTEPTRANQRGVSEMQKLKHSAPPKIGRNDPCPCGSGKKFKKCDCDQQFRLIESASNRVVNAHHEAGHAVFNVLLDFPLDHVTIIPSGEYASLCDCLESSELGPGGKIYGWRHMARLVTLMAGPEVEWSRGTMPEDKMPVSDSREIRRLMSPASEEVRGEYLRAGVMFTRFGLSQRPIRRAISRVAQMLLTAGRVEGSDVHREVMAIAGKFFVCKETSHDEGFRKLRFGHM
jgi:hypothetical protein